MTLTQTQPKPYPGMLNDGIEFFAIEGKVKVIMAGSVKNFTQLPFATIQLLDDAIENDKPLKMALLDWHPNSKFERLEQFAKCRFGGLDFKADIDKHQLQDGEYWDCPKRNSCAFNGIVCHTPQYRGVELTPIDIELMKLISTNLTNEAIADQMDLAFGTFHKFKKYLYAKLGVQTKPEVALIATTLNII